MRQRKERKRRQIGETPSNVRKNIRKRDRRDAHTHTHKNLQCKYLPDILFSYVNLCGWKYRPTKRSKGRKLNVYIQKMGRAGVQTFFSR